MTIAHQKEFEQVVISMVESGDDPMDIIAACKDAIITGMINQAKRRRDAKGE
jgi:hypothetical protein